VASIVDLRVFWQPGSVLFVLNCRDYSLFESNKFLLLLLLLIPECVLKVSTQIVDPDPSFRMR